MKLYNQICTDYASLLVEDILLVLEYLNTGFARPPHYKISSLVLDVSIQIFDWSTQSDLYLRSLSHLRSLENIDINDYINHVQSCVNDTEGHEELIKRKKERNKEDSLGVQLNPSVEELIPEVILTICKFCKVST